MEMCFELKKYHRGKRTLEASVHMHLAASSSMNHNSSHLLPSGHPLITKPEFHSVLYIVICF